MKPRPRQILLLPAVLAAWLGAAALAPPLLAAAASHAGADHEPLPAVATLTLAEVIESALARSPDLLELPARREQAAAWRDRSASLLADQPALSFRYQSDRLGGDAGLREYEGGLLLPLWRPGERRAARGVAHAMDAESGAVRAAVGWEAAGLLRRLLWDLAEAEKNLQALTDAREIAGRLAASVVRRHELGDLAATDVLLTEGAELAAEEALVDAQAALVDAQRQYRVLTGLAVRPPFAPETMSSLTGVPATHPALALAQAELDGARARADLARRTARGGPTVLIGPRWERPAQAPAFDDSIGITVSIPIPGTAHAAPAVAAAGREVAAAQARHDRLARTLELALHEAAHGLEVAQINLRSASRRAAVADRHVKLGRSAYAQGEMNLMDLLRLQESTLAAQRQRSRLEVAVSRQIALYNQAVGDMP